MSDSTLWLIPALPFAGFLILALAGSWLPRATMGWVGVGSVGLSALVAFATGAAFLGDSPPGDGYTQTLGDWLRVGDFEVGFGLHLDALALLMVLVITAVGFLIHLYSMTFMAGDSGYRRYFAYLNLFVAGMLVLVLADNLLFLFLGWELVGLCSYLLIGHDYADAANGRAARKAFVVTRCGDAAMLLGLVLLLAQAGTLDIQTLLARATTDWGEGSGLATAAAALLLAGAVGKSAQVPLQVWLPDAMAGPSPVSALIHAATMATAGVYLIARTHPLSEVAPVVQAAVAVIGAVTLLLAAFAALAQRDIKRILAYSTISQIGYMFLALGVSAYAAAMFHFMTHAFFKALLFLAAGVVIHALDDEHDIFRMGGLRHRLRWVFLAFLAGGASLASVPLISAGFYSKELILWQAWNASGGFLLWGAGLAGALITALYTFRLIFVVFLGPDNLGRARHPRIAEGIALALLSVLALVGGFVELPATLGGYHAFSGFIGTALPVAEVDGHIVTEAILQVIAAAASIVGIVWAYRLYGPGRRVEPLPVATRMRALWASGWGFDRVYDRYLVQPLVGVTQANRNDVIDTAFTGIATACRGLNAGLARTQTGEVRWYAAGIACGAVIAIAVMVLP